MLIHVNLGGMRSKVLRDRKSSKMWEGGALVGWIFVYVALHMSERFAGMRNLKEVARYPSLQTAKRTLAKLGRTGKGSEA